MISLEQLEAEVQTVREARRDMTVAARRKPTTVEREIAHRHAADLHNERADALCSKVIHMIAFHEAYGVESIDAKAHALAVSKVYVLLPESEST